MTACRLAIIILATTDWNQSISFKLLHDQTDRRERHPSTSDNESCFTEKRSSRTRSAAVNIHLATRCSAECSAAHPASLMQ